MPPRVKVPTRATKSQRSFNNLEAQSKRTMGLVNKNLLIVVGNDVELRIISRKNSGLCKPMKKAKIVLGIALSLTCSLVQTLKAQYLYVSSNGSGTIGEYTTSGATINASFISGLNSPAGIAFSGNDLFVANSGSGTIGEYTASGATVNASLISGLSNPYDIAISGNNLFVLSGSINGGWSIGEYTTSGAVVNSNPTGLNTFYMYFPTGIAASGNSLFAIVNSPAGTVDQYSTTTGTTQLITGLTRPGGIEPMHIAASGNDLFISIVNDNGTGLIGEYTTSGGIINASLISGLNNGPSGIAILGNDLFVADYQGGSVSEYTTSGAVVYTSLITGLSNPGYIALGPVPEPSAGALTGLGTAAVCLWLRRK